MRFSNGMSQHDDEAFDPNHSPAAKTGYKARNALRGFRCWYVPYLKSRYYGNQFRPLLSYLYTEFKCNVNCHYCYTWDNKLKGMTIETAKKSIDFLKSVGCRVVAIMGGEPLLRKNFILDVVRYGSENGFFMYLPTNGILLDRDFIDKVGDAGVAAINLALDVIEEKPGLPKAYKRVEQQFKYLVKQKEKYGYIVFFNINITTENIEDVKLLTEIAHDHNIGTDYHINECPVMDMEHYKFKDQGLWITEDYYRKTDELIDWLIEKNKQNYPMVNSIEHLRAMKPFIRHQNIPWKCRAGYNSLVIRMDGTLAPCFELYSSEKDWGRIFEPKFNHGDLELQKAECNKKCLSTCNYQVHHYYNSYTAGLQWVYKHFHRGFFHKGRRRATATGAAQRDASL